MKNLLLLVSGIFVLAALSGCGPEVPTKELENAKTAIERAKSVEAPTYSKEDYEGAVADFTDANQFVTDKKYKEAKDKALSSITNADKSYQASLEKRAEVLYQDCTALMDKATGMHADVIYPGDYSVAKEKYTELKEIYNKKDYEVIYTKGSVLKKHLEELIEKTQADIDKTRNIVSAVQEKYDNAEANSNVRKYALDELKEAIPYLDEARQEFDSASLEAAIYKAGEAESIIDEAVNKANTTAKSTQGNQGIKKPDQQVIDLDKQMTLEIQKKKAEEFLDEAKQRAEKLKKKNNNGSFIHEPKKLGKAKVQLIFIAEDMDSETNTSDIPELTPSDDTNKLMQQFIQEVSNRKAINETNITRDMVEKYISLSEEAYSKGEYLDSIDYSREAIRLADILIAQEQYEVYVVKLNPANRDCLWKIAGYMYQNNTWLWPVIWRANKYQIQDPDLIFPDQKLKIPPSLLK